MQILLRWVVNKQTSAVFQQIDHFLGLFLRYGRTAETATHIWRVQSIIANVVCPVHHHSSFFSIVVKATLLAGEFQRQAVLAKIGAFGHVKTKAAL